MIVNLKTEEFGPGCSKKKRVVGPWTSFLCLV